MNTPSENMKIIVKKNKMVMFFRLFWQQLKPD